MKYCVSDKKVFPLCLFSVNPPKKCLPDKEKMCLCKIFRRFSNRKNGFAKFSSVFQTEKMALQNFPAFFKLKKWLCKIFQRFSN
jgi:hypothetical protein